MATKNQINFTNLIKEINAFLTRTSKIQRPPKTSKGLASKFLRELPEYKENYSLETIAGQIDCILAIQII